MIVAGPMVNQAFDSNSKSDVARIFTSTPETMRRLVDSLHEAGADFIKTYFVSPAMYFVIAAEARRLGMPFGGHGPYDLDHGQWDPDVVGVSGLTLSDSGAWILDHGPWLLGDPCGENHWDSLKVEQCAAAGQHFRRNGTWVVVNLTGHGMYDFPARQHELAKRYVPTALAQGLDDRRAWLRKVGHWTDRHSTSAADWAGAGRWLDSLNTARFDTTTGEVHWDLLRQMPLLAGTDAVLDAWGAIPGFSLHDQLALYVAKGGLSPLAALQAATLNPAHIHNLSATGRTRKTVTCETGRLQFSSKRMKTPMYTQITAAERYTIARLRQHGYTKAAIARLLSRHRSTISREVRRNATRHDGGYRAELADSYARTRRSRSRRNQRFSPADWAQVYAQLRALWSPEQIAGRFRHERRLRISHETIYRHIWADKRADGTLHTYLRGGRKHCRKRYGSYDSRGRLAGKRPITTRPAIVETRERIGDWEVDTIVGPEGNRHCVVSLVERKTGYLLLGKLRARTVAELNRRAIPLLRQQSHPVYTLTCDNGTEFHGYATLEAATAAQVYFATPHHAWERGTNENTNGLIRQYLPKRTSMAHLTQQQCTAIARQLNQRPRKRLGYRTPEECYA